jgi:hypothetical protein
MQKREEISKLTHDELVDLVIQLAERIKELEQENERLKRGSKRQAAPFSNGTRSSAPKRPGRKPGKGPFTRRSAPAPESITSTTEVALRQCDCPHCGLQIEPLAAEQVTITELPELPQAEIRAYILARGRCQGCGRTVRAEHPDVAADQLGATAHRLGPRLSATAAWLRSGYSAAPPAVDVLGALRRAPDAVGTLSGSPA